ncbi:MAG TPA: P1 family peptidase [Alphaproteobacteria bacterium]|nr:P1 family peptidase [Alphaproteobacteria bacterium]
MARARLRDLGLTVGVLPTGELNAITDVAGVEVGYSTVIADTPRVVRTGVTAIWPRRDIWTDYVFAGTFSFNGNGEMTGLPWIAEQGTLGAPIGITNTYQVGIVRDAICALAVRDGASQLFHLPVVAETYDGWLSDIQGFALTQAHALAAFDSAKGGPIAEGNVGGGAGMICHEFKGGTGTASRVVTVDDARYTVGALVQANYGLRDLLRVGGVPVGREIGPDVVPAHRSGSSSGEAGSIIVILATDAPLLPIQCQRLARRATTGLAWVGGIGANGSGDIFLAFATGNHLGQTETITNVRMLAPAAMDGLFRAAAEATEEAILNALCMAETMTGREGRVVHALPLDRLQSVMRRYRPELRG